MRSNYAIWLYYELTPRALLSEVLEQLNYKGDYRFELTSSVPGQVSCQLEDGLSVSVKPLQDLSNPWKNAGAEFGIETNCRIVLSGESSEQHKIQALITLINRFIARIESDVLVESRTTELLLKKDGRYQIPAETWEPEFLEQMRIRFEVVESLDQ